MNNIGSFCLLLVITIVQSTEVFECSVCCERRIVSHTPPCKHPICSQCLFKIANSPTIKNLCPFCREPLPNEVHNYEPREHPIPEQISMENLNSEFPFLCSTSNLNAIQDAVRKGANINASVLDGRTPILISAEQGCFEIVQFLHQNRADVKATTRDGKTPIYISAQQGHLDVVKHLQQNGADVNAEIQGDAGVTPISVSASKGHLEVVKFLQQNGANVNTAMQGEMTPLFCSASNGHLEVVKFLQQSGADVNAGFAAIQGIITPIFISAANRHVDIVRFLKEHGAEVTRALELAEQNNLHEIIHMLSSIDPADGPKRKINEISDNGSIP